MLLVFPAISAALGPLCGDEEIKDNSNFIIKGKIIDVNILDEWVQGDEDYYTKFASVEIKIKVLNVIKGDKKINEESKKLPSKAQGYLERKFAEKIEELREINLDFLISFL